MTAPMMAIRRRRPWVAAKWLSGDKPWILYPAVDASTPPRVTVAATTATTAAFSPPNPCLLLALPAVDAVTGTTITVSMSNSGTALTWNTIAVRNLADGQEGYVGAHYALVTDERIGMTVTATASVNNDLTLKVYVITNANSTPLGGFEEGNTTTNDFTTTGFTVQGYNSLGFIAANDTSAQGGPTGTDTAFEPYNVAAQISGGTGYKQLGAPGTTATFSIDGPGATTTPWSWVALEIKGQPPPFAEVTLAFADTETDTATALVLSKDVSIVQALGTGVGHPLSAARQVPIGVATEANTSTALTLSKTVTAGQGQGVDTGHALSVSRQIQAGLATDNGTATSLTVDKLLSTTLAQEPDAAQSLTPGKFLTVGEPSETDTAQAVTTDLEGELQAPVFVAEYESSWAVSTTPKTISVTTEVDDVLVLFASAQDFGRTIDTPTGGTNLTWTLRQSINTSSFCPTYVWTAVATTAETFTLSVTAQGTATYRWGFNCLRFTNSSGVGNSNKANSATGTPSVSLTTTQDKSAIVVHNADWDVIDGSGRVWLTSDAGSLAEVTYFTPGHSYTVYGGYHADSGAAGSKTVGLGAPAGQQWSIVAVEVKGEVFSGTITLGVVTETNTAQPIVPSKTITVPQSSSADTAQSLTISKRIDIGIAVESETATQLVVTRQVPVTQPLSSDTSTVLSLTKSVQLSLGTEADTAQSITRTSQGTVSIGLATETDSSVAISPIKSRTISQAQATNTTQALIATIHVGLTLVEESDTATTQIISVNRLIGTVADSSMGFGLTPSKAIILSRAQESDLAFTLLLPSVITILPEVSGDGMATSFVITRDDDVSVIAIVGSSGGHTSVQVNDP
jgi:hypothetical protein